MQADELAREWFAGVFGEAPPRHVPWMEWAIEVHDNDGTKPLYELNRGAGVLHVYLHEKQRRAWDSQARFVFLMAGKQFGKTILGPLKLFQMIQERGLGDYLAISATFDLFKLKLLPEIKQLFVIDLGIARYWAGDQILELMDPATGEFGATYAHEHEKMAGRIILRTADSERGLQSATAKGALLDEAGLYSSEAYKDIRGRLTLHQGKIFAPTTPYNLGWLKQQIYDAWLAGDPEIEVIQAKSKDSPFFPDAEYESLKRSMQTWQFRMDYDAEFGRPPAAIYEDYKDELREHGGHLVKRFVIPKDWPRMVAIDPGIVNPGKLWIAQEPETGEYFIYRAEKGGERRTSKEHAAYDVQWAREQSERVIWWAIGAKSEKYWREDYKAAGAQAVKEPTVTDVEEGIDRGTQLIKTFSVFVFDDLTDLRDEFLRYAREIKDGQITEKIADKSTFHLIDSYRYFAVQVVKRARRGQFGTGVKKYA